MAAPVIPVGVSMATIAWLWTAAIGDETTVPSGLTVTFDPAPEWLQYTAATPHMTIAPWSVVGTIDTTDGTLLGPDGTANVTLLPTDDTDLNPSAWTYQVTVRQGPLVLMDFPIAAPGGVTTDLATVTPIAGSTGNAVVQGPPWVADGTVDGQVPTWNEATGKYIPTAATGSVDSVNGVTPVAGDVTLTPSDIGAQPAGSYATAAQGAKADTAVQPGSLATVATTGAYADLSGKPTIPIGIPDPSAVADGKVLTTLSGAATWGSSSSAFELRGTGFPEGVVTASPGTYYTDTAGTNGAWRWLKTSGTGATGWVVTVGDTGVRIIPFADGTVITVFSGGNAYISRTGSLVSLTLLNLHGDITGNQSVWQSYLPIGFGPKLEVDTTILQGEAAGILRLLVQTSRRPRISGIVQSTLLNASITWVTADPWPPTLPGTPA